jgi:tetratricopeptide (TPR) repeat protein
VTAARNTGLRPIEWWRRRSRGGESVPWDAERVGVVAVALAALVFGLHSAIDWTWFVPAPAVMAVVAAGFVAGRGPVTALAGGPGAVSGPAFKTPAVDWRRKPDRGNLVAAGVLGAIMLLFAWTMWQPERSQETGNDALRLAEQNQLDAALEKARDAESIDPLSPRPLFVQALVQHRAGDRRAALATLERAVLEHPGNPRTWEELAQYQLERLNRPREALSTLQGALYLDPRSRSVQAKFVAARARLRAEAPPPAP